MHIRMLVGEVEVGHIVDRFRMAANIRVVRSRLVLALAIQDLDCSRLVVGSSCVSFLSAS